MKKLITLFVILPLSISVFTQSPNKMSYQAVIRKTSGELVTNQVIGLKVSILQGSPSGSVVYSETYSPAPQTNANGLVTVEIGSGSPVTRTFTGIDWAAGPYYLKTETDPTGGTSYTISGTNQLLSVPYALYSKSAASLSTPYVAGQGITISANTIGANLNLQVSTDGDILSLTPGNSVFVPGISSANKPIPIITTKSVTNITATKAYGSGSVLFYSTSNSITETGICWSLNQPPTVSDGHVASGVYDGGFICLLEGLTANTLYFARAYAKTGTATYYGETVMFTTSDVIPVPTLTTTDVSGITETTALSGGYISSDGGSAVTARGVCWNTSPAPTTANSKTTNGTGNGLFTSSITGLTLNTKYYIRAYATNSNGTNYGPELFFKTAGILPSVTTSVPVGITTNSAVFTGNVTAQGSDAVTERGVCLSVTANPTIANAKLISGSGIGAFNILFDRFKPNRTYNVRAFATNSVGTSYGQNHEFTTLDAYYEGFETGFPGGSTGGWGIITGDAIEGYYFLYTNTNGAEASLTRTLLNSGQITFWARNTHIGNCPSTGTSGRITFYIDDIEQGMMDSSTWLQKSFPVTAGLHTFKWKFAGYACTSYEGWIDFILMPK